MRKVNRAVAISVIGLSLVVGCLSFFQAKAYSVSCTLGELQALVAHLPGVTAKKVDRTLFLQGEVDTFAEVGYVVEIVNGFREGAKLPDSQISVTNLVRLSERGKKQTAEQITGEIKLPEVVARFVGDRLFLEGLVETDFEADRSVEIARTYLSQGVNWQGSRQPGQAATEVAPASHQPQLGILVDMLRVKPPVKMGKPMRLTSEAKQMPAAGN